MARATEEETVVFSVSELFPVLGSASLPSTLAVLVNVPAAAGWTVMVTVALSLLARLPRVQVTVLTCINKRIIQQSDFDVELGGAHRLNPDARRRFLLQYEERKNTEFK